MSDLIFFFWIETCASCWRCFLCRFWDIVYIPVYLSICTSFYFSVSIHPRLFSSLSLSDRPSTYLFVHLATRLPVCPPILVCLSVYLPVHLHICLPVLLCTCLSVCPSTSLSLSTSPSVQSSTRLSVYPSTHLPTSPWKWTTTGRFAGTSLMWFMLLQ